MSDDPINAELWSESHPIGTAMLYRPIRGKPEEERVVVCSAAWPLGHGAVVAKVTGRAGGVLVSHLRIPVVVAYVEGADRNNPNAVRSHIYVGPSYSNLEGPLCFYGWNRSDGGGFSILRGWTSTLGTCKLCLRAKAAGVTEPAECVEHKTRWL